MTLPTRASAEAPTPVASSGLSTSRGLLATAAAGLESFFLDSAAPAPAAEGAGPVEVRPVVCVFGLARGCGATVVARALAAELAIRDGDGAAVVCSDARPAAIPLATHSATRLARILEDVPGAGPRAVGRLCLVSGDAQRVIGTARYHAPVVIDAGSDALGGAPATLADRTVIVTTRDVEPALARVASECIGRVASECNGRAASECIGRVGQAPVVVLNRAPHDQPGLFALPNSALGARLALGGREARGELGRAIAELVDLIEEEA